MLLCLQKELKDVAGNEVLLASFVWPTYPIQEFNNHSGNDDEYDKTYKRIVFYELDNGVHLSPHVNHLLICRQHSEMHQEIIHSAKNEKIKCLSTNSRKVIMLLVSG